MIQRWTVQKQNKAGRLGGRERGPAPLAEVISGSCHGRVFSHPKEVEGSSWHFADSEGWLAGRRVQLAEGLCNQRKCLYDLLL